jgi:hypothetical protein
VLGDPVADLFPVSGGEPNVAAGAAGKGIRTGIGWKRPENLLELFVSLVAPDEQMVLGKGARGEAGVPRQNDAVLFEGKPDDIIVREGTVIEDVKSGESHPSGEVAQHHIGDELHKTILPRRRRFFLLTRMKADNTKKKEPAM